MLSKTTVTLLASTLICGCSSSAAITRTDGTMVVGKIQSSTSDTVLVQRKNQLIRVPRAEIEDIDHPGNVLAVIGGLVSAYGAANIAIGAPKCDEQGAAYCVGVALPAAAGVFMLLSGLSTWSSSTSAAESPSASNSRIVPEAPSAAAFDFSSPRCAAR